tara:strand:+ start:2210 stop:2938 length:729 start_codon:yes stop_codon:yes gene_type:complete
MTVIFDTVDIDAADYGNLSLTTEQTGRVIFSKYESHNPEISDTIHGDLWVEEVTEQEHLGIAVDDGCIVRLHGTPRGEVGISKTGDILTSESASMREEVGGEAIPRYMAYDFRVAWINKTDGPERNNKLIQNAEQRKLDGEKDMFDSIASAFQKAVGNLSNSGETDGPAQVKTVLDGMTPDELRAMADMAEINADDDSPGDVGDSRALGSGSSGGDTDGSSVGAAVEDALNSPGGKTRGKKK